MPLQPKPRRSSLQAQAMEMERSLDSPALDLMSHLTSPDATGSFDLGSRSAVSEVLQQRVVILIDGLNLFYAAANLHIEIDYVKLLARLIQNRRLVRAYFYTGADRTNEKQLGFLHWMRRNGYRVVAKDLIQFPDGSKKANVEVEISIDMMTLAKHCDTIILLSGDGNLTYAVNTVAYQGVQIELVSLRSMTSDSLINVADQYIDLDTIKHHIQR